MALPGQGGRATPDPVPSTSGLCPICGGAWDDYWDLVFTLVDIDVDVARVVIGL